MDAKSSDIYCPWDRTLCHKRMHVMTIMIFVYICEWWNACHCLAYWGITAMQQCIWLKIINSKAYGQLSQWQSASFIVWPAYKSETLQIYLSTTYQDLSIELNIWNQNTLLHFRWSVESEEPAVLLLLRHSAKRRLHSPFMPKYNTVVSFHLRSPNSQFLPF